MNTALRTPSTQTLINAYHKLRGEIIAERCEPKYGETPPSHRASLEDACMAMAWTLIYTDDEIRDLGIPL